MSQEPLPVFTPGIYQHGKTGRYYLAFGLARHSETEELLRDGSGNLLISYVPLYYPEEGWEAPLRPLPMWSAPVSYPHYQGPRFRLCTPLSSVGLSGAVLRALPAEEG